MTKAAYPTIGVAAFVMFVIVYFINQIYLIFNHPQFLVDNNDQRRLKRTDRFT